MSSDKENDGLVACPFCGESDFDLIGLKSHLQRWCKVYDKIEDIGNPMIDLNE